MSFGLKAEKLCSKLSRCHWLRVYEYFVSNISEPCVLEACEACYRLVQSATVSDATAAYDAPAAHDKNAHPSI